jgi:hypothetical protein
VTLEFTVDHQDSFVQAPMAVQNATRIRPDVRLCYGIGALGIFGRHLEMESRAPDPHGLALVTSKQLRLNVHVYAPSSCSCPGIPAMK